MKLPPRFAAGSLLFATGLVSGCFAASATGYRQEDGGGGVDAGPTDGGSTDSVSMDAGPTDGGSMGTDPPQAYNPCRVGSCWTKLAISGACGVSTLNEDFSSGRYNVHRISVLAHAGVAVDLAVTQTAGSWEPALIVNDEQDVTVYDGERGVSGGDLTAEGISTGRGSDSASVRILAQADMQLLVFVTGWHVIDGGFSPPMPTDVTYSFTASTDCETPTGLLSPPNFDDGDVVDGYFLLPQSDPPGLYTRKPDDCSRGTRLLIDVLYTVAVRWNEIRPEYSPISFLDLNEGSCSTVDHATHDDGTHADLSAGCATEVSCANTQPAIDLAMLFVDTGEVCGIVFNDSEIQDVINPYFEENFAYEPWWGTFMRTTGSHTHHFHVRVKKPDGACN